MAAFRTEETALGSARGRFLESLPRKAIELRGWLAQLTAAPAASAPRDEARRRLHALFASALVFRSEALASLVQEGIARLDAAAERARALSPEELDALSDLVKRIAEFRADGSAPSVPTISDVVPAPVGRRRSNTLTGLSPVGAPVAMPSEMPGRWVGRGTGRPAEARRPALQRVLHVLVLAPEAELAELRQLLHDDSLRVSAVATAREALESAADGAPDVILAAAALIEDGVLIDGLRASPLTDFVPLVAIARSGAQPPLDVQRAPGVDELVTQPLRTDLLLRVLGRATGTLVDTEMLPALREASIEEVAARVGEEIRRGLVDAAESGRDLKVPLGEGTEVLAAAWAAVARVRALFSERSGGRVRFSDRALRATPALLTLSADAAAPLPGGQNPIAGRRIVVADDDATVVQGFARLLREEGAYVTEVGDGAEALRAARRERPDLVIGDVIMPGLDGFALCRELKRDPLLADVPVILISWKEDLLSRMRELASGASGYLTKEASATQIVASVREVLAPRSRLEVDLAGSSEVRGNLEGTGVVALMRSVRRARPDARVTLRDAWNLFECELREGRLAQLTRTASDGSFVRNERALPQLLGVGAGRFAVTAAEGPLKQALEGSLDEVLARGARELGAQLDALSGAELERVERLVFDEDAQAALLDQAPPLAREVMRCLSEGERPGDLWRRGVLERGTLEAMLRDMAKRGVIRAVLGPQREDLVAVARAQRSRLPPTELGSPPSMLPPAPVPVISVLPEDRSELPVRPDPLAEHSAPREVVVALRAPVADSAASPPAAPAGGRELAAREPAAEAIDAEREAGPRAPASAPAQVEDAHPEQRARGSEVDERNDEPAGDTRDACAAPFAETEVAPFAREAETARFAETEAAPFAGEVEAAPFTAAEAAPFAREAEAAPFTAAEAAPFAREAEAAPFAETEAAPFAVEAEAAPFAETEAAPFAVEAEAAPFAGEAESAPFAGEAESAPFAREAESAPFAVEAETAPFAVEAEAAPFAREAESAPFAREAESAPAPCAPELSADAREREVVPVAREPSAAREADLAPVALAREPETEVLSSECESGVEARESMVEPRGFLRDEGVEPHATAREQEAAARELEPSSGLAHPSGAPAEPAPRAGEAAQARTSSDARELDPSAAEARSSRGTLWAWTAAFVALVAIGFLLDRARAPNVAAPRIEAIGAAREQAQPALLAATETATEVGAGPAQLAGTPALSAAEPAAAPPHVPALVSGTEGGFEISDRILDVGVEVAPDQALLVVEAKPGADGSTLALDGEALGALPVKLGVSEGIHELAITRGDSVVYRFLAPRRGSTWLLREP